MNRGGETQAVEAVDAFLAAVDTLMNTSLMSLTDNDFVESLIRIETATRKLAYTTHGLVMEANDRGLPRVPGRSALHGWLVETLNLSKADAWRRIDAGEHLRPMLGASGAHRDPVLPNTAAAQAEGAISPDHVARIIAAMNKLPGKLDPAVHEAAEHQLAEAAREVTPHGMLRVGETLLACLDPDGTLTSDADRQRRRTATFGPQGIDGMSEARLILTPSARARFDVITAKFGRPGMCNPDDPDSPTATTLSVDRDVLAAAAKRDTRTPGQRNHDALVAFLEAGIGPDADAAARTDSAARSGTHTRTGTRGGTDAGIDIDSAARSETDTRSGTGVDAGTATEAGADAGIEIGNDTRSGIGTGTGSGSWTDGPSGTGTKGLGVHRGIPVSVVLTMTVEQVEKATGYATTATGGTVPMVEALRMAEGAHPLLMIFDHTRNKPLHLGVGPRLANRWQRLARIATERGCTRPGCEAPATMCQMHHVLGYAQRGSTDIENLTLACDACHALITGTPDGWETQVMGEDSDFPGRVAWRAPAHIDPHRRWRVNHAHHGRELLDRARERIEARLELEMAERRARTRQRYREWQTAHEALKRANGSL